MKKRWKIFWIVCGSMFLIGIICCSVSWGMGTTMADIAHQFPYGIGWVSENETYSYLEDDDWDDDDDDWDDDDDDDWDDDDDDDWDDDDWDDDDWDDDEDDDRDDAQDAGNDKSQQQQNEKQKAAVTSQEKENMRGATGIIEGNGKEVYPDISRIKSTVRAGRIHLKTQSGTDEITVESKGTHEKLGFRAYAKNGTLYLTSDKKITKVKNIGKGTITVTLPEDMELEEAELNLKAGELKAEQIHAKNMEVNAGAGEVSILEFASEKAEFKCGAGSVTAAGDVKEKIDADCGVGEIHLKIKGKQKDYNYDLDCGIGEIKCGDYRLSGFGAEKNIDNGADKKMDIDCGIGSINVSFMEQI